MEGDENKDIDMVNEYENVDPAKEIKRITKRLAEIERMASERDLDSDTKAERKLLETRLENLKKKPGESY